jgi:hypothetical protein
MDVLTCFQMQSDCNYPRTKFHGEISTLSHCERHH